MRPLSKGIAACVYTDCSTVYINRAVYVYAIGVTLTHIDSCVTAVEFDSRCGVAALG